MSSVLSLYIDDEMITQSENIPLLAFAEHNEYFDEENFFDFLESKYGIKNDIFSYIIEDESVETSGVKVIKYFEEVLDIIRTYSDLPYVYTFEIDGDEEEELILGNNKLQCGYNYCIAENGDDVVDLRDKEVFTHEGKDVKIVKKSVKNFCSADFEELVDALEDLEEQEQDVMLVIENN